MRFILLWLFGGRKRKEEPESADFHRVEIYGEVYYVGKTRLEKPIPPTEE
ncbi:MAG: hypothetical protein JWN30_1278 [Bacilli bacterium]|nr:hypothetical protein [Bacilli bacterium]